jgi:aminoglycoside phosphotransferase (APT) family kinase protein
MVRIPESIIEKLNIEETGPLVAHLRAGGWIGADENPEVRILRGGVSNRTVLVRRPAGEAWVLKQALPKLRVAVEWLSPPERIFREALGMRHLADLLPAGAVPALIFEDRENFLLAMSAVPEPHRNWKTMLLDGELADDHIDQFALLLASLHAGRGRELRETFADTSFFESLRLEPYYAYTAECVPAARDFLNGLITETRSNRVALVHGDFSPKNILVRSNRLVLIDHEVIHFGDPAFDLGFSLTHLLSKANHLPQLRDRFRTAAIRYWNAYVGQPPKVGQASACRWSLDISAAGAGELEARAVRHTLGCLLARVDGRSPLEYLTEEERSRQRSAVLDLMSTPPASIAGLVEEFIRRLNPCR